MQDLVNTYFKRFMKEKRARRRFGMVLLALALVVGAGVYWQLHLTGEALSNETGHQHDESCYEEVLVCDLEESEGHTHSEDCYAQKLICGLEESEEQTDTDDDSGTEQNTVEAESDSESQNESGTESESEIGSETEAEAESESETKTESETAEVVLTQQTLTSEADDAVITVSGLLPEDAFITAEPVNVEIEGQYVLFAFDISILYSDEEENEVVYEPEDGAVSVTIESAEITGDSNVYYVPEEGEPEKLENEAEEGSVAFEAEHFSVYVVTSGDSTVASGTIENSDGTTITWVVYEDLNGDRTLVISSENGGAIPDYTSADSVPWRYYIANSWTDASGNSHSGINVVIEDGVTGIGSYTFTGTACHIASLDIGDTVKSISSYAFYQAYLPDTLVIPDSVETIGANAFNVNGGITSITLGSGLVSIGESAFSNSSSTAFFGTIYLPASVTSIGGNAFKNATGYAWQDDDSLTMDENGNVSNGIYTIVDGVLYSADLTTLVDYPGMRVAESYRILDGVTTIKSGALSNILQTKEIIVPSSVTTVPSTSMFNASSGLESVIFEDGANANCNNNMFFNCTNLISVTIPNTAGTVMGTQYFWNCSSLTSISIPENVTTIRNLTDGSLTSLESVYYDAASVSISGNYAFKSSPPYTLTIGADVDTLPKNFDYFVQYAESITFEGPNFITVTEGAFASASDSALSELSGYIYVDAHGAIYQIDTDNNTATLVYVPAAYLDEEGNTQNLTSYTVLASITDTENGESTVYTVTAVASEAFRNAENLTSLIFEDASVITSVASYAMANATKLASVTDQAAEKTVNTVEEATALFINENVSIGYQPFYNTALGNASGSGAISGDMDGSEELKIVASDNNQAYMIIEVTGADWTADEESEDGSEGGYSLLTGDALTVTVTAQAPSAENTYVYRIYLSYTDSDYILDANAAGYNLTWGTTDDPNTVYVDFTITTSETISFSLTTYYPNVTSDGGGLTIWGEVLSSGDTEEKEVSSEKPTAGSDTLQAWWETEPDTYELTKTNGSSQSQVKLYAEDGEIRFASSLTYEIKSALPDVTETYGRDLATSAYYEDVLTLSDGVEWDPYVLSQIKEGNVYYSSGALYVYDEDGSRVQIVKLSVSGSDTLLTGVGIKYEDSVVLYWTVRNKSTTSTLSTHMITLSIYPEATAITDVAKLASTTETVDGATVTVNPVIQNEVNATYHYTYSEDQYGEDSVTKEIVLEDGELAFSKTATSVSYFGQDVTYTLKISNSKALTYTASDTGVYTLVDTLSKNTFISAENMEAMLISACEEGYPLTITIDGAVLGVSSTATDVSGEKTVNLNAGNTSLSSETTVTLTITCGAATGKDGEITYTYRVSYGESAVTGSDLESLLQNLGYGVTNTSQYTCTWTLGGGETTTDEDGTVTTSAFQLEGGTSLTFEIPATTKNTFQMLLDDDRQNLYDLTTSYTATNNAYIRTSEKSGNVASKSVSSTVKREAYIAKSVYSEDGTLLTSDPSAADGDILEYRLAFRHTGNGEYDDLPMVDDLYGSQLLLVPYEENESNESIMAEGSGAVAYDADGDESPDYYYLGTGTYYDVVVGVDQDGNSLVAAVITVEEVSGEAEANAVVKGNDMVIGSCESGWHTQIKWYYDHLDGGSYTMTVSYQVLVKYDEESMTYSLGNVVWMNDRTGSRIYDTIWGGGTLINFKKNIVVEESETNDSKVDEYDNATGEAGTDSYDDDDYSTVQAGESVTYALILSGQGSSTYTLRGGDLWDLLPETYNVFEWVKNSNVTLTYEIGDGITVSAENVTGEGENDLDAWSIVGERSGLDGSWIQWPENMTITFNSANQLIIYVTLTFPEAGEDGVWSDYVDAVGGTKLENTMYVRNFTSTVTHDLVEEASVILQKGVWSEVANDATSSNTNYSFTPVDVDLNYFNNQDSFYRYVVYYVTLYNEGNTRLYLSDLTDALPDGYTYVSLVGSASKTGTSTSVTVEGGTSNTLVTGLSDGTVYRSATITRTASDSEANTVTFTVSGYSGDYDIKYDEERGMYYLDKGEALVFGYVCRVGSYSDTGETATNTISMEYYDYLGAGVSQVSETNDNYNVTGTDVSYGGSTYYGWTSNDGSRDKEEEDGTLTLSSTVTQRLGEIIPGVAKAFTGYTDSSGTMHTDDITSLNGYSTETLYWKATLTNDGERAISDYTITDTMPLPYVFTGAVTMTTYSASGSKSLDGDTLFTIGSRSADDETVTVTLSTGSGTTNYTLTIGGDEIALPYPNNNSSGRIYVSLAKDADGNEVLTVRLVGSYFAVPESGKVELTYSSVSPSGSTPYSTYVNSVTFDPDSSFESKGEGTLEKDETEENDAVSAVASVTVAGAYATSSYKSVAELETDAESGDNTLVETDNSAISTSSDNSIVLSSAESIFRYTLSVDNLTDYAMTRLILFDNLPEVGDTYSVGDTARDSEFTVNLAEEPNFAVYVTVTGEDGETTTIQLTDGYYKIQYSTSGEFDTDDYEDADAVGWTTWTSEVDATSVRAIRIIITDESATQIPAGATVTVTFDAVAYCKEGESIDPGAVAWNNFGYHYALNGVTTELTAMPLVVGVKVPSAPELTKKLVDLDGNVYTATEEKTFTFVIYRGNELTASDGSSYAMQDALTEALDQAGTAYKIITVTMPAGSAQSEKLILTGTNGLTDSDSWWTWEDGASYTITEFLTGDDYSMEEWNSGNTTLTTSNSCTFTYDRETTLGLTCTNTYELWSLNLTKVDAASYDEEKKTYSTLLKGAVFALYTRDESKRMPDDDYKNLSDEPDREITVGEGESAVTWYLYSIETTDSNGAISWTDLTEDSYYLVEVKAPDGYNLSYTSQEIGRKSNTKNIIVENEAGYELPVSGGSGIWMFSLIGMLLCGGAIWLLYMRKKA
ncbi:MAG: leucine-rich repeat protein [Lachnospiraceae bacterium]|nr:leucine-rich repeat protein [Lachnospiraceae bacterium]